VADWGTPVGDDVADAQAQLIQVGNTLSNGLEALQKEVADSKMDADAVG
jgi:hypothetical protein